MPTRQINSREYTPAERMVTIPDGVTRQFNTCEATFSRESWPTGTSYEMPDGRVIANTAVVVFAEQSLDGVEWTELGTATFPGGTLLHPRTGEPVLESKISWGWTGLPKEGSVRIRVVNTVTLTTGITARIT